MGPLVDSFHNQCLLRYNSLPISLPNPLAADDISNAYWFSSSWTVPPLLGVAYVVLGGILPRVMKGGLEKIGISDLDRSSSSFPLPVAAPLQQKAWTAVVTTALIIKLSELLETQPSISSGLETMLGQGPAETHIFVLLVAVLAQWALLDATWSALLVATLTSLGGPLSELPFVALGVWEYLPSAGDYLPLVNLPDVFDSMATVLLGDDYRNLALSSITGPCYFAVTMDAIALGRWFDEMDEKSENGMSGGNKMIDF